MMHFRIPRLTLFGRSVVLISCELFANAVLWIVSGLLFGRDPEKRSILNLALLAWVSPRPESSVLYRPADLVRATEDPGTETRLVVRWYPFQVASQINHACEALDADHIRFLALFRQKVRRA